MAKFDITNGAERGLALSATLAGVTPAAGAWIDMQGFGALNCSFATGVVTDAGAAAGFSFEMQESDTTAAADATAVADANLIGTEAALSVTVDTADREFLGDLGYNGQKRYVRIVATGTAATDAEVSVQFQKEHGAVQAGATIDAGTAAT
jgi:hypothetical protein